MNRRFLLLVLCSMISFFELRSQSMTLSLDNALNIVRKFHPVVNQSNLIIDQASNSLQASRGVFDPTLLVDNDRKTFDNKRYFNYYNPELRIPTWYGIDFKAGIENNVGDRLNTALTPNRSAYMGVSLDPLRGLIYDKRRAAVQQANIMVKLTRQEQQLAINDLLFETTEAYWEWVNAYLVNRVFLSAVKTNEFRFDFVKKAFQQGDRASIDTVEALSQLQLVQTLQLQAALDLQKARFFLSNYFWTEQNQPYVFGEEVVPDTSGAQFNPSRLQLPVLEKMIEAAMLEHPKLNAIDSKRDVLEIDRKVKTLDLLPSFKINYNFLDKGYNVPDIFKQSLFQNNYKYGVSFGLPLLQRQARGELSRTKNKISEIDFSRKLTELEIQNKIKSVFAESTSLMTQINVSEQNFLNNKQLLDAENMKFSMGESSMFLVNAREIKLIESEQKLIALKTKFFRSIIANQWAAGLLR
jgi:outer membrane protein TolC